MKTLLLTSAAALTALGAASTASAQTVDSPVNLGVGYTYVDADGVDFDALTLRGGYDFTPYLGIEGEALIGLGDEDVGGFDASLDYGLGAFAKAQYPLADNFSIFGRLGYVWAEVSVDGLGSDSEDGVGYGAGVEYAFNGANAIRGEYTRYDFEGNAEADGWSVSYVRRF